jgi:DNA-binding NarL/FixJ family response regulator
LKIIKIFIYCSKVGYWVIDLPFILHSFSEKLMKKIKILIADDHKLIREGLIGSLKVNSDYIIVGEAADGLEVIEKAGELLPDIILMDISMPKMNGIKATKNILKNNPDIKILVLSGHDDEEYIEEFIKSGAKGYILKNTSSKELMKAIDKIKEGSFYFDPEISVAIYEKIVSIKENKKNKDNSTLTEREIEILILIAEGFTNKQISDKLKISIKTVIAHRENIREKVKVHTTAELTKYAIKKGYIKVKIEY